MRGSRITCLMTKRHEREILKLATVYLHCRCQAMGNHGTDRYGYIVFHESHDYQSLQFAMLGMLDYAAEIQILTSRLTTVLPIT